MWTTNKMQKQISKTELVGKTTFFQMSCCFLREKLLFASCVCSLLLTPWRWDLRQKHFCFFFMLPLCSQICIFDSAFHIYKCYPAEGRHVRQILEHHEQHSSSEASSSWTNDFWGRVYFNLTAHAPTQVKPRFVTNESSEKPWRAQEYWLFVFLAVLKR